ncbi:MAG: hypothetical protein AAF471_01620 [Myxococcota bacterium]
MQGKTGWVGWVVAGLLIAAGCDKGSERQNLAAEGVDGAGQTQPYDCGEPKTITMSADVKEIKVGKFHIALDRVLKGKTATIQVQLCKPPQEAAALDLDGNQGFVVTDGDQALRITGLKNLHAIADATRVFLGKKGMSLLRNVGEEVYGLLGSRDTGNGTEAFLSDDEGESTGATASTGLLRLTNDGEGIDVQTIVAAVSEGNVRVGVCEMVVNKFVQKVLDKENWKKVCLPKRFLARSQRCFDKTQRGDFHLAKMLCPLRHEVFGKICESKGKGGKLLDGIFDTEKRKQVADRVIKRASRALKGLGLGGFGNGETQDAVNTAQTNTSSLLLRAVNNAEEGDDETIIEKLLQEFKDGFVERCVKFKIPKFLKRF